MASSAFGRLGACCLIASASLGSMLLFSIQPLAGKLALPRFGGTTAVWQAVNLAFQAASCLGFFSAWVLSLVPGRRWGLGLLLSAWALALLSLWLLDPHDPKSLPALLAPFAAAAFALGVAEILFPYWFGRAYMPAWVDPYFVFAFTHLGGPLAILTYLFVVPWFMMQEQVPVLCLGLAAMGLLWTACATILQLTERPGLAAEARSLPRITLQRRLRWVALAVMPATLMLLPLPNPGAVALPFIGILSPFVYQLTWIVAYARMPLARPSLLAWIVQIVAVLTCWQYSSPLFSPIKMEWYSRPSQCWA